MSYRNDPYDPKQAALLDPAALEAAVDEARRSFDDIDAELAELLGIVVLRRDAPRLAH